MCRCHSMFFFGAAEPLVSMSAAEKMKRSWNKTMERMQAQLTDALKATLQDKLELDLQDLTAGTALQS